MNSADRRLLRWAFLAATLALACSCREDVGARPTIRATTVKSDAPVAASTTSAVPAPPDAPTPDAATPDTATSVPTPLQPGQIALRYACNEKYKDDDRCAPSSEEYARWLAAVELRPSTERLVEVEGGGPMGAEWNPSNDIVLFAAEGDAPRSVRVGSKSFSGTAAGPGRIAFRVPLGVWKRVERPLRAADGFGTPPDRRWVKVVRMDLLLGQGREQRPVFFLTAYGE
ncbi:hypothetical protein [Sorangium sp. So ce1024]|uniref:hypothetical protein n=1 Tax=Sorangium sp. So ce1024 TaxID=3133327 RepID=UPI003EFD02A4